MMDGNGKRTETHGQDGRAPFLAAPGRRVLAVRGGALGDFILTLPALNALREGGYAVELMTRPAYGRLALEAGLVSGWRSLDSPEAALLMVRGAGIGVEWREWLSGFDAVVSWVPDADGAFRSQVLSCGAGGFYQGDGRCGGSGPAALQLAQAVAFTRREVLGINDLFARGESLVKGSPPRIAFHPGSGSARKNWPLERWVEVMKFPSGMNPETTWLVITGEVEEERLPRIAASLNGAGVRWESAHALDLTTLCDRLRHCCVLLGHDSGVSHLAAACGVPCRLLFGPTDPSVWAPLGHDVESLTVPGGNLNNLQPEEVIEWLGRIPFAG